MAGTLSGCLLRRVTTAAVQARPPRLPGRRRPAEAGAQSKMEGTEQGAQSEEGHSADMGRAKIEKGHQASGCVCRDRGSARQQPRRRRSGCLWAKNEEGWGRGGSSEQAPYPLHHEQDKLAPAIHVTETNRNIPRQYLTKSRARCLRPPLST